MNERLRETAHAARDVGFIDTLSLSLILAAHPYHFDDILGLWKRSGLDIRGRQPQDPRSQISNPLKIKISEDLNLGERYRVGVWGQLISRWTTGRIAGIVASRPLKIVLNTYRRLENGFFKQSDPETKNAYYIRLEELRDLLERFRVALPEWLYDPESPIRESRSKADVDELILQHGIAAEQLYNCVRKRLRGCGKTLTSAEAKERRNAANMAFDATPSAFHPLTRDQIDTPAPYEDTEKFSRKMIGTIILAAGIPGAEPNYQKLYNRFLQLKSSK